MKLSVIISVFNEEQALKPFYNNILSVLTNNQYEDYELLFVNDGSNDNSQTILETFAAENERIKIILFSRNFGHEAAMIAGIDNANGDVIICMDSDLQHPPSMIPRMLEHYLSGKSEIITMVRTERQQNFLSKLFYRILNRLSAIRIEANASDFFLISGRIAKILREDYRERARFLRGFIQIVGFKKDKMEYEEQSRTAGKSKYSYRKLISLSDVAIASLSKMVLNIGIYVGFLSGFFGILLAIYSIVMKIIEQPVSGYTTIVVFMSLMFSIQFFILGIIGKYIGFLFDEQKKRPIYVVDKKINF